MRPRNRLRLEAGVGRKFNEQLFVGDQIVEHRAQKRRVRGRGSKIMGAQSGHAEESAQPVGIGGNEGERAHRQRSGGIGACGLHRFQGIAHSPIRLSSMSCALILPGAPAEFTLHGTPDAQDRAHC